jgi:hypothetical protein
MSVCLTSSRLDSASGARRSTAFFSSPLVVFCFSYAACCSVTVFQKASTSVVNIEMASFSLLGSTPCRRQWLYKNASHTKLRS